MTRISWREFKFVNCLAVLSVAIVHVTKYGSSLLSFFFCTFNCIVCISIILFPVLFLGFLVSVAYALSIDRYWWKGFIANGDYWKRWPICTQYMRFVLVEHCNKTVLVNMPHKQMNMCTRNVIYRPASETRLWMILSRQKNVESLRASRVGWMAFFFTLQRSFFLCSYSIALRK